MMYLIPGILGFIACCLFDINKIRWNKNFMNLFFVIGSSLLIFSTVLCILQGDLSIVIADFGIFRLAMLAGLILSVLAEIYALFFALPFESTYMESDDVPVVNQGWYGSCRHPGFWTLAFVYLFLWLFLSNIQLLYAFITYTICNFLYILVQDVYIFPRYIRGYDEYKKTVPFLLPTKSSLKCAFSKNDYI